MSNIYFLFALIFNLTILQSFNLSAQSIDGEPVSAKLAKKHLKEGQVYYLTYETTGLPEQEYCKQKITTKKYGFRYYRVPGCARALDVEQIKKYNKVVLKYLNEEHGDGWQKKLVEEFRKNGCI